jgi:glycosyltransferase involved in cell wall biosynthesis
VSSSALRIEMILPSMPRAGMEMVSAALGRALHKRGHEVGFTCIEGIGEVGMALRRDGFRVVHVDTPGLRPNLVPRELGAWFRTIKPDVVHIHSGVWLKAAQAAHHARVRSTVYTLHGIRPVENWYTPWYNRLAAMRTGRMVAVSGSLRNYLVNRIGVPQERVHVVHNGVSTESFQPRPRSGQLRREFGIPEHARVIGCVARLHPVKNHDLLIDAFARVRQRQPEAFLLLVGDGARRAEVQQKVQDLQLQHAVRITGELESIAPVYNEMEVFALSSHIEGTSISILEAMSSGVPVVATAVGGNPALLDGGRRGLLAPAGDVQEFAMAILRLLADDELRQRLSEQGRTDVASHYSVERMAEEYEHVYIAAVKPQRHQRRAGFTHRATHERTAPQDAELRP